MVVVPYEAEPQPKYEIRISKFETNSKHEIQMTKTLTLRAF